MAFLKSNPVEGYAKRGHVCLGPLTYRRLRKCRLVLRKLYPSFSKEKGSRLSNVRRASCAREAFIVSQK
jgi:hypothetical protein